MPFSLENFQCALDMNDCIRKSINSSTLFLCILIKFDIHVRGYISRNITEKIQEKRNEKTIIGEIEKKILSSNDWDELVKLYERQAWMIRKYNKSKVRCRTKMKGSKWTANELWKELDKRKRWVHTITSRRTDRRTKQLQWLPYQENDRCNFSYERVSDQGRVRSSL